jgi:predicted amidophosphoribosyltransferase
MALENCQRCNGIFNRIGGPLCPTCVDKEEKDFRAVNEALRRQPHQKIDELAEQTGVSEKTIMRFIKDKRIASDVNTAGVKCGKCGAPAISLATRLCERCAGEIAKTITHSCSGTGGGKSAGGSDDTDVPEETVHETMQRKLGES